MFVAQVSPDDNTVRYTCGDQAYTERTYDSKQRLVGLYTVVPGQHGNIRVGLIRLSERNMRQAGSISLPTNVLRCIGGDAGLVNTSTIHLQNVATWKLGAGKYRGHTLFAYTVSNQTRRMVYQLPTPHDEVPCRKIVMYALRDTGTLRPRNVSLCIIREILHDLEGDPTVALDNDSDDEFETPEQLTGARRGHDGYARDGFVVSDGDNDNEDDSESSTSTSTSTSSNSSGSGGDNATRSR